MTCVGEFLSHDNPQTVLQPFTVIKNSNERTTMPGLTQGGLNNMEGPDFSQSNTQWFYKPGGGEWVDQKLSKAIEIQVVKRRSRTLML